jgi:hypothetical protein
MKTWSTPVRAEESAAIPCTLCGGAVFKPALYCEDPAGSFSFVRCKSCGLVQRNPQPVKERIMERYSGVSGKDYLNYELENEAAFLKLQQLALKDAGFFKYEETLLSHDEAPSVLDIGCATGALLASLRSRKWRVT